jgi:phosphohistidine phosphatase SixA
LLISIPPNTIRTRSTVKPTADLFGLTIETYSPQPDSSFIRLLKSKRKNVLVVGHSNTIDDIANMLCGLKVVPGDLKDNEYDNLYLIKKKGNHYSFTNKKYGTPNK